MDDSLRKFRDRLRIIIILYVFCKPTEKDLSDDFGVFHGEIKIQALDFLLRYPDFLSMELMALMEIDESINQDEVKNIITEIYSEMEPVLRVEEMEKFFHGAYESIDDVIAFHVSIGFLKHDSKRRIDGKNYDKNYYITALCAERINSHLRSLQSVSWYFKRCELLKKYFNKFSGSDLKERQYKYSEYKDISYKSHIQNINDKVRSVFKEKFHQELV